jgi:hypothetical protein
MRLIALTTTLILSCAMALPASDTPPVKLLRLPESGVQPQVVVDRTGAVHAVYLTGDPRQADVFYIRSSDYGRTFSDPVRVNSQPESAVAAGAIRGAQLAVGRDGRVHVAWNGSSIAQPRAPLNPEMPNDSPHNGVPMLYSRRTDKGVFEPQRNLMRKTFGLDGGGSVAADAQGNVYVAWHGKAVGDAEGEGGRRVWLARSADDGETFVEERPAFDQPTGACGCCGMRLFADSNGNLLALYRSARDVVHRDVYLLSSTDQGETFRGKMLHPWEIGACPMSSMFFLEGSGGLLAAWETAEQVFFSSVDAASLTTSEPVAASGAAGRRKYPVLAQDAGGRTLLVWATSKGWGKPPDLHWQILAPDGTAKTEPNDIPDIPAWSFAAAFASPDGGFTILY